MNKVWADVLDMAYEESGPADGPPVILLHGFPYSPDAYAEVAPILAAKGCRVLVPYLRGYGPTRFRDATVLRSGQQAAMGHDLLAFMDGLGLKQATLAGFDWGGRAANVVAALWPERARCLVSQDGYAIQDIAASTEPAPPEAEHRLWYQYYFHGERGVAGLTANRAAIGRLLWQLWSPDWKFDDATYDRTTRAFDNPDFVRVVIHSYRHRFGLVAGDPYYVETEAKLAKRPKITVPTVCVYGLSDGVRGAPDPDRHKGMFTGWNDWMMIKGAGHNTPQEAPQGFAAAVLAAMEYTK